MKEASQIDKLWTNDLYLDKKDEKKIAPFPGRKNGVQNILSWQIKTNTSVSDF